MLDVNAKRVGACAIIAKLIPHVMVNMKVNSLKAIRIITTTIVRKFLLCESNIPFADGYTTFIYNMHSYSGKEVPIMEDTAKPYMRLVANFVKENELEPPQIISKETDLFALFMSKFTKDKFYRYSKVPTDLGVDVQTSLYIDKDGLMPFPTYWKLTEKKCNGMPKDGDKMCLIPQETVVNIELIKTELKSIMNKNKFIRRFIYIKIGEIIYLKYGKENTDVYLYQEGYRYLKNNIQKSIYVLGECYVTELKRLLHSQ